MDLSQVGNNLRNLFNQGVNTVGNAVQGTNNLFMRPIQQGAQAIQNLTKPQNFGNGFTPPVNRPATPGYNPQNDRPNAQPALPNVQSYFKNQVSNNVQQGAQNILDRNTNIFQKALGGAQVAGGLYNATPAGIGQNALFGTIAGEINSLRSGKPLSQTIPQGITGNSSVGQAIAGSHHPLLSGGIDLALNSPEMIANAAKGVRNIAQGLKNLSPNAFNIHPDDERLLRQLIDTFQTEKKLNPNENKMLQTLADHYLGQKYSMGTTKNITNTFDAILSNKNGGLATQIPGMNGLVSQQAPEKPPVIASPSEPVTPPKIAGAPPEQPPVITPPGQRERKFVTSVKESSEVSPQVQGQVSGNYTVQPNKVLTDQSAQVLGQGLDKATNQVLNELSQKKGVIPDQAVSNAISVAKSHDAAGNFDQATQIYNQLAEQLTKAGRTVQAASLLSNRTPQGLLYSSEKTLKQAGVALTPGMNNKLQGFIDGIKQTQPGTPDNQFAVQKLVQFVNQNIPRSKMSAAFGIWRAGLLTGPETVAKVAVSHAITAPIEMASQIPSEIADRLMSLVTGKRTLTATTQGFGSGFATGVKAMGTKLATGLDVPNTGGFESEFGSETHQTPYEALVGNVHGSLFKPTYTARFQNSLNDQALTEATNQGLKGAEKNTFVKNFVANAPEKARNIAAQDAERATNQNTTSLGKLASSMQSWNVLGVPIGKILTPFTRIPSAIGTTGIVDYTPFGIGREVVSQIQKGIFNQRTMAQAIGRSATGTTVLALGSLLASKGLMTLKAPSDPKERALWETQGKQPNSININGKWISLNAFGPAGITMAIGAGLQQSLAANKGDIVKAIPNAVATGGRVLLDQPYLKGISGVANALNDPTRYGSTLFNNTAGSIVPAMSSQIARGSDTVQRMFPNDLKGQFQSEIPGLRQNLPPQRNLFGDTLPGANPNGTIPGAIVGTINPFYPSTAKSDPVSTELQRLYNTLGSGGAPNIAQPPTSQTIYGNKVKLTNDQLSNFIAAEGPQVKQALQTIMSDPSYQQLTDDQKSSVINQAISQFKGSNYLMQQTLNQPQSGNAKIVLSSPATIKATGMKAGYSPAQLTAAKDAFANGTSNFQDLGNIVLRKDASGNVTAQTKDAFNTSLYEGQMTTDKLNNDAGTWYTHAQALAQLYQKQLQDPNVDQLDKVTLENKLKTLANNVEKYQQYGGFSKPKTAGRARISIPKVGTSAFKPVKLVMSKPPKIPKPATLKVTKGSGGATIKTTAAVKAPKNTSTSPRIYLSATSGRQTPIRKAAGISIPTSRHVKPKLTA